MAPAEAVVFLAGEQLFPKDLDNSRGRGVDVRVMVEDVDLYYAQLTARDVEIAHTLGDREYGMRDFIIRDCDGYRLRFGVNLAAGDGSER